MLKRIFALMLLLCVTFSFCSCGLIIRGVIPEIVEELDIVFNKEITENTENTENIWENTEVSSEEKSYKDILCVESNGFKKIKFSVHNDNTVFYTSMPDDLTYSKALSGGLSLIRDGRIIGTISTEANEDIDEDAHEFSEEYTGGGISAVHHINRLASDEYVHYYVFDYKTDSNRLRTIYITVDYCELDEFAADKLLFNITTIRAKSIPDLVSERLPSATISRGANIMILGNSFIGSSSIGSILEDMCGYPHYVDAVSIGYATVSETYSVDESILSSIRYGYVDALFICGFYSYSDADALSVIVDACEESNTKLFIFPAHNESESVIERAVSKYDYPVFLDWKGEIDLLIDSGVDYDDFCIADAHKHSTPLAGYVGAHMIYRTLFGEMPPEITSVGNIDQAYVEQMLGDYVDTGTIEIISENEINRIN